jgi:outer membrane protein
MRLLRTIGTFIATVAVAGFGAPAKAGDYDGNFMIRLQGTAVVTQDSLRSLTSSTLGDLKALGFDAEVTDVILLTATLTYFFNRNLAVELFCCFSKHEIELKPPAAFAALADDVAETWIIPPILTLQHHFTGMGAFKPYIGAGFQYIHFFSERTAANTLGATSVSIKDAFGPAFQMGVDIQIGKGWYLNAEVNKV